MKAQTSRGASKNKSRSRAARSRSKRLRQTALNLITSQPLYRLFALGATVVFIAALWLLTLPKPVAVTLDKVGRGRVEAIVTNTRPGVIDACQRARLSTIPGGRIDYLGVSEGDRVQAGQVLMRLWQGDLLAKVLETQTQLGSAHQRQREACTVADQALKEATRQAELVARKLVSASAAEKARREADARAATCANAGAEVDAAQHQLESVAADIGHSVIVAPFAGTVAKINGNTGVMPTPSPPPSPTDVATPPAIDLINDSCLYVRAPMDATDAPGIQPGQPVRISVDAIKDTLFTGRVRQIASDTTAEEKQAHTVTVEIDFDFDNPADARKLLVGYSVDIALALVSRDDALLIPSSALREGNKVLMLNGGRIAERTVKPGIANLEQTEIIEGLAANEQIITSSTPDVVPGIRARAEAPKRGNTAAPLTIVDAVHTE